MQAQKLTLTEIRECQPRFPEKFRIELVQGMREIFGKEKSIPWKAIFQRLSLEPDFNLDKDNWKNVRTNMVRGGQAEPQPSAGIDRCLEIVFWLKIGDSLNSRKSQGCIALADDLLTRFCDYHLPGGTTANQISEDGALIDQNLDLFPALCYRQSNRDRIRGYLADVADKVAKEKIKTSPRYFCRPLLSLLQSKVDRNDQDEILEMKRDIRALIERFPRFVVSKGDAEEIRRNKMLSILSDNATFASDIKRILIKDVDTFSDPEMGMSYLELFFNIGPHLRKSSSIGRCKDVFSLIFFGGVFRSFDIEKVALDIDIIQFFDDLAKHDFLDISIDLTTPRKMLSLSKLGVEILEKGVTIYDDREPLY